MGASGWVHIDVERIMRETDAAFLVRLTHEWGGDQIWLPKSQVSDGGNYSEGDVDLTMSITEWIAG